MIKSAVIKHGKSIGWSSVGLAIVGLIAQAISQHNSSTDNRAALWAAHASDVIRIEALEKQQSYNQGFQDALKLLTENEKSGKN